MKIVISVSLSIVLFTMLLILTVFWSPPPPKEYYARSEINTFEQLLYYHKKMHGEFPKTLHEIDPDLLSDRVPNHYSDPWGYEYVYKNDGADYELYSIGLNQHNKIK